MSDAYDADLDDELDDTIDPDEEDTEDPDDELEPEELEEEPSEQDEPPARQPSRSENRVAKATRDAAEARREAKELRERLAALETAQSRPTPESQTQRQERLAAMEPWERTEFLTNERLGRIEWDANERADKLAFQLTCQSDPIANKLKDDVEREIAALRQRGQNVDRDTMLTFLLGQRARANAGRAKGKATKVAQANRERQQGRAPNSRGDTAPSDRRGANTTAARDKRLSDMNI